jgi:hypothetical protein
MTATFRAQRLLLVLLLCLTASSTLHAAWPPASPYAGQQQSVKALSDEEMSTLLSGQGSGFAKPAELNGYPGPAHVLELAGPLGLDAPQLHRPGR